MEDNIPSNSNPPSMEPNNYKDSEIGKMSTEQLACYIRQHLVHPSAPVVANFVKSFQMTGRDFVALTAEDIECMLQGDEGLQELVALRSSMSGSAYHDTSKSSPHLRSIFPECSRIPTPPTTEPSSSAPHGRGELSSLNESLHLKLDTLTWNFEEENILLSEVPFSPDHLRNPSPQQWTANPITYIDDESDVILSPGFRAQSIHPEFPDNILASPSPIPSPKLQDSRDGTSPARRSVTEGVESTEYLYDDSDYYEYPSSDEEEAHALSNASVYAASCKTPPLSNIEQADDLHSNEDVSADINDHTTESRRASTVSSSSSEICLSRAAQTACNSNSLLNAPSSPIVSSLSSPPPRSSTLRSSSDNPVLSAIQNDTTSPTPMLSSLVWLRPDEASYSITAPTALSSSELSTASQHSPLPFDFSRLSLEGATSADHSASFDILPFYIQHPDESPPPAPADSPSSSSERESFAVFDPDWEHSEGDRQTGSYLDDDAQEPSVNIEEHPKDGVTQSILPPTIVWRLPEDTGLPLLDHQDFSLNDTPEPTWRPTPSSQHSTRRKVLSSRVSNSERPFFSQNTNFLDRTSRSHETRPKNTDKGKGRPSPNHSDSQVQTEPVPSTVPTEKLRRAEEKCESLSRSIRRLEKDLADARTESSRKFSCRSFWSWSRDSGDANLQVSAFPDLHFAHLGR